MILLADLNRNISAPKNFFKNNISEWKIGRFYRFIWIGMSVEKLPFINAQFWYENVAFLLQKSAISINYVTN